MKRILSLAILLVLTISTSIFAQKEVEIEKRSFRVQLSDGFIYGKESEENVSVLLKKYDTGLNEIKSGN